MYVPFALHGKTVMKTVIEMDSERYIMVSEAVILTRVRENKYGCMGLPTRTTARRDLYVYSCVLFRPLPSRRREKKEGLGLAVHKKEFFRELELDVLMALAWPSCSSIEPLYGFCMLFTARADQVDHIE